VAAASTTLSRKREATCNAILEATSKLVAEKGTDGFTISEVALRSGINRALIYHYFKDRNNLVFEAIRHLMSQYEQLRPAISEDAIERDVRMHIEHPEIGRFFFQMLLSGKEFPSLSKRMLDAIEDLERLRTERQPDSPFDPPIAIIMATLVELAWPFARGEMARLLKVDVEEADRRFVAQIKRASHANLEALGKYTS
jgi:AcrR family transcriptional regulator